MFHFIGRRQLDIVSAIPTFHACVTRRRVRRGALSLLTNAGGVLEVDACLTYSGPVRSDTSADHIVIRINDGDVSSPAVVRSRYPGPCPTQLGLVEVETSKGVDQ